MEKGVDEILDACARLLTEMKSGTKDRTMVSTVNKALKRRVQETHQQQQQQAAAQPLASSSASKPSAQAKTGTPVPNTTAASVTTPSRATSAPPSSGAATPLTAGTDGAPVVSAAQDSPGATATAPHDPLTPATQPAATSLQQFLCSEDEVSKLVYACRMAIIGESGGVARGSVRALTAALEWAAVVLTSGVVPLDLVVPVPTFAVPESSASGAQVFFSKLLGGKKSAPAAATAEAGTRDGAPGPAAAPAPCENMRDRLVDAVLASVDMVQSKESSDRLYFVMIAALKAAAVPRLCRTTCADVRPASLRSLQLSVHGVRLVRLFRVLLGLCARPQGVSPILIDEAQKALHAITRSLSKYVEQDLDGDIATQTYARGASSILSSAAGTPLMPLSAAAVRSSVVAGKPPAPSFDDPTHESTETDDGAATDETGSGSRPAPHTPVTAGAVPGAAPAPAAAGPPAERPTLRKAELPSPAVQTLSSSPRRQEAAADMRLLLELCGHIARLTPLSGISSMMAGVSGPSGAELGAANVGTDGDGTASGGAGVGAAPKGANGAVSTEEAALTAGFPAPLLNTHTLTTSLSFLLYSIVNGGPQFRKSPGIVQLLRQVVVPAAIRTSISADLDIFRLSINVLLTCCLRFGPQMVSETSTVFRHVYFRVLVSSFTSLEHKLLVLDAFASYIEEPQLLLGLFLNYDCNTHSQSIYEMMIHYLGALAVPPAQGICNANLAAELKRVLTVRLEYDVPETLRRKALVSLLQVADSNIQWIERFECDQEDDASADSPSHPLRASTDVAALTATGSMVAPGSLAHDPREDTLRRGSNGAADGAAAASPGAAAGVASLSSAASADTFLQVRRYKDAFKKFLELFNVNAKPDAAIEYLKVTPALLEGAEQLATPATPGPTALTPPPPAGAPTDAAPETNRAAASAAAAPSSSATATTTTAAAAAAAAAIAAASSDVDEATAHAARQVAAFLRHNEEYIDKMVLGDYFAKCFRRAASRVVFEAWIGLHDFTGKTLDEALRLFLGGFKLLGEAQVVDRTMELFAAQYCRQNPGIFGSADTAFILSFSICMLNTDAHSPHIKNKMTREGFIQNNRGIDEGNDLDPAILGGIYDRISREEVVLRPSPKCGTQPSLHASAAAAGGVNGKDGGRRGSKLTTNLLDSIPLLRHLSPIAAAITDKVLLPMDAAGNALFNFAQRKREEMYQQELRATLKDVMDALQEASTKDAAHHAMFVTATSIENALPMWEVTVDVACHLVVLSLQQLLEDSERYVRPPTSGASPAAGPNSGGGGGGGSGGGGGGAEREANTEFEAVTAYMEDTQSAGFFSAILQGLHNTVRVCCSFGNVSQTEQLLEHMFELTRLTSVVVVTAVPSPRVTVQSTIPRTRLQVLSTFLNLFVHCGSSFNSRGWQAAYKAMSLVDALANGIEGMWRRQTRRLLGTTVMVAKETGLVVPTPGTGGGAAATGKTKTAASGASGSGGGGGGGTSNDASTTGPVTTVPEPRQYADLWFGALNDVPASVVDRASRENRKAILAALRATPTSHVDLWLDHLFDATQYPPRVQLEMTNGLVKVCEAELQYTRTFSLTKLFDFVSICASFSSRLQWRDLWGNASEVFSLAGCRSSTDIALSSLDGLRLVALTYLMREELLNYSFQKEVLKPFESILMSNQNVECRQKIMTILSEVIDFRAAHLASGWNVVFSCLSHGAAIPEVAPAAWSICEGVMLRHIDYVKDCFSDLIFCLTTFACSGVEESMPLRAISYLVACGHWLQYGLEAPPPEVRAADAVSQWVTRFATAEQELAASHTLGRHLARVTLAAEPLTQASLLQKPTSFTSKTKYHLWMSLFEGMVPIVVVHSSVRVRAHALSSIWALLAQYACLFDAEVQNSLFSGMVRPMLTTLLTHVPENVDVTSPPMSGTAEFDRFDYRLLVYFALKGMLLACKDHAHLLELACAALAELTDSTKVTLSMLRNSYVDEVLRVCYDFVWAAASLETIDALDALGTDDAAAAATGAVNYAERLYQWIPSEARHRNPFVVGLVHEVQQVGVVDVVRFKRTAGWTELHQTPAAQKAPVPATLLTLSATSVHSASAALMLVRTTVFGCLTRGLLGKLHRLLAASEADRDVCLEVAAAMRHVLLGVSFYFLVTRDARAAAFLKSVIATTHEHCDGAAAHVDGVPPEPSALALAGADTAGTAPAFMMASPGGVLETLLLVPYACVLLEFVAAFQLGDADAQVVQGDLAAYVGRFVAELRRARQCCVELQRTELARVRDEIDAAAAAVTAASPAATTAKRVFKEYKGCQFSDMFRSGRYPIAARSRYLTAQTDTAIRQRVCAEWCYLLHIYALKCTALLGTHSVLLQACPTRDLMELLRVIPSALEEGAVTAYFHSCWEEMDLHCSMPPEPCMQLCTSLLQERL